MLLRKAYEQAREHMIKELERKNYHQTLDGRELSQCTLTELKNTLSSKK